MFQSCTMCYFLHYFFMLFFTHTLCTQPSCLWLVADIWGVVYISLSMTKSGKKRCCCDIDCCVALRCVALRCVALRYRMVWGGLLQTFVLVRKMKTFGTSHFLSICEKMGHSQSPSCSKAAATT
jgi:hypothetical protein